MGCFRLSEGVYQTNLYTCGNYSDHSGGRGACRPFGIDINQRFGIDYWTLCPILFAGGECCINIYFLLGRFLHNTLIKGIPIAEKTNHILGAVLGILQATLAIYFILCVGNVIEQRIQDHSPGIHQFMTQSQVYQVFSKNNLIENFDFFSRWKEASKGKSIPENNKVLDEKHEDES